MTIDLLLADVESAQWAHTASFQGVGRFRALENNPCKHLSTAAARVGAIAFGEKF
jgi:hypothetical protein